MDAVDPSVFAPPIIEEVYDLADALVVAGFLLAFAPCVDSAAVLGSDRSHVFCGNRSPTDPAPVAFELDGPGSKLIEVLDAEIVTGSGPEASNTWGQPDVVRAESFDGLSIVGGRPESEVPPLSFAAATARVDR